MKTTNEGKKILSVKRQDFFCNKFVTTIDKTLQSRYYNFS